MSMIIHVVAGSLILTLAAIMILGFVRDRRAARRITALEGQIADQAARREMDHAEVVGRFDHLEELIKHAHGTEEYAVGFVDGIRARDEAAARGL